MTTTDKPRRKRNPAWQDSTRNERQQRRTEQLNVAAQVAGFDTWRKLETAVVNGAMLVIIQAEPDEFTQEDAE